jgi:hypothetical protein
MGFLQSGRRAFESRLAFVESSSLCLLTSPARRTFKDMAGQLNHFLITILVGLSAVEDGTAELPPGMRTSWAPHDRSRSAVRSRQFAIRAALAWLVDALDTYIRMLQRPPKIATIGITKGIADADVNGEGLAGRVRSIAAAVGQAGSAEAILTEVAIVWRNRLIHQHAANKVSKPLAKATLGLATQYAESYQGLIIEDLIKHVEQTPSASPTIKEVTAIVRAVHKLVERVDENLLRGLGLELYLREVLGEYLTENRDADPGSVMVRASNVWGKSPISCLSTIRNIALNNGLTVHRSGALNELTMEAAEGLVGLSPSEAVKALII